MALMLLKRVGMAWQESGLIHQLLIPDLREVDLKSHMYEAVVLANLWRLRRGRPYCVVCLTDDTVKRYLSEEDRNYIDSMDSRLIEGHKSTGSLVYIGTKDIFPFVPRCEDDFILLCPEVPPEVLPRWPYLVSQLNSLYLTRSDEFLDLKTIDPTIEKLLQGLPER